MSGGEINKGLAKASGFRGGLTEEWGHGKLHKCVRRVGQPIGRIQIGGKGEHGVKHSANKKNGKTKASRGRDLTTEDRWGER